MNKSIVFASLSATAKAIVIAGLVQKENNKILDIIKGNSIIVDGHMGGTRTMTLTHVGRFIRNEREYIVPMFDRATAFCFNPLEIINGKVVLSSSSVGGSINLTDGTPLVDGIEVFNKESKAHTAWECGQITELIAL